MQLPMCAWKKDRRLWTRACTHGCVIRYILARYFWIVGTPLALGSWYTLALTPVLLIVLLLPHKELEKVRRS